MIKNDFSGCWYCKDNNPPLYISREFDCVIHIDCIINKLKNNPDDPEANIFKNEFKELFKDEFIIEGIWE